jgi:RNA polymerase sigma-70 factor (ECF subfamily)
MRDFYPWYIEDQLIEVPDEVAAELRADKLYETAHRRQITRNKAQYSLDCEDGIEYTACLSEPTPPELLERKETFCRLCRTLNSLPKAQGRRIDACIILGKRWARPKACVRIPCGSLSSAALNA